MAFTTQQLQALQDALASGELEVQFDGKVVKYRSISELKQAIAMVTADLTASGALSAPTPRTSFASFCKD